MEKDRIAQYEPYLPQVEEPIRQIVRAIWDLPFVRDTGFTCSGHLLSQPDQATGRGRVGPYGWHLHRAMLELAFSSDETLREERDSFRNDLRKVRVETGGLVLCFDDSYSHEDAFRPYSREAEPNLRENFNARLPESLPEDLALVEPVEALLTDFWEEVAGVLRRYHPQVKIDPIHGKNFRKITNWISFSGLIRNQALNKGRGFLF